MAVMRVPAYALQVSGVPQDRGCSFALCLSPCTREQLWLHVYHAGGQGGQAAVLWVDYGGPG